ncbi:hypothetical protein PHK61_10705 [Actinomycetospora lutea]|uniref:DUF3592 domain-containing protein n=1 Tax=Actinomycetospora lutea TaxID=663604 RepID=UPI002365E0AD|nr:DUF3592 domain-containing protein [Actinomycetospora lutea]MDD7938887.1 hypothetical protein [Actinomycetospora lutea]
MADVEERPRARSRAWWSVATLGLVGLTLWLLWQAGTATWDAAVLALRGEVVSARVIDAQLHTKLGMADDLVVVPAGSDVAATVSTHREDLGVGAVVDVVVDPDDPTRADLASDGWPWLATVMPLFLAFVCGVSALLTLSAALGLPPPDETDGTDEPGEDDAAPDQDAESS